MEELSTTVREYRRLSGKHGRMSSMIQKGTICGNEKMHKE